MELGRDDNEGFSAESRAGGVRNVSDAEVISYAKDVQKQVTNGMADRAEGLRALDASLADILAMWEGGRIEVILDAVEGPSHYTLREGITNDNVAFRFVEARDGTVKIVIPTAALPATAAAKAILVRDLKASNSLLSLNEAEIRRLAVKGLVKIVQNRTHVSGTFSEDWRYQNTIDGKRFGFFVDERGGEPQIFISFNG